MALGLAMWLLGSPSAAYETDQFNNRLQPLADSRELLNERVNQTIADIAQDWRGGRDESRFVNRVYHAIGGVHWVDKLERWAMKSSQIERLDTPRRDSIYAGHPFWATRVAALFGVGPTIKVNQVLIGSDKLGHFLSQGRKFWRRFQRYHDEARAAEQSAFTERAIFGQLTTGAYSNADLVANYEGFLFYRSLFEDGAAVSGKPAILAWRDDRWEVQRPFDFADHVNAYWDEALNISHFDTLLYGHMRERMMEYCGDYHADPQAWQLAPSTELQERYRNLQLRDSSELRLSSLCAPQDEEENLVRGDS